MKTYYELITTYYADGHVTSRIYPVLCDRKPAKRKHVDLAYTAYYEYYIDKESAKKAQSAYLF